jgi:hypothetical protein
MSLHLGEGVFPPTSNGLGRGAGWNYWHLSPPIRIGEDLIEIWHG